MNGDDDPPQNNRSADNKGGTVTVAGIINNLNTTQTARHRSHSVSGIVDTTKSTRTSAIKPINGKNNSSKRSRDSPGKTKSGSKQSKLQHYWLNKPPESANRFSILDTDNELSNEDDCQEEEVLKTQNDPKPPPIYVFKVEFIQPLKYLLKKIAADNYELKILLGN